VPPIAPPTTLSGHAPSCARAEPPPESYSPRQTGDRFSANATAPSIASFDPNIGLMTSDCLAKASLDGQSAA